MNFREYRITLNGESPLLLHADNLDWRGKLESWQRNPLNKKNSKAGDDRTPAWRWLGCCYHDGKHVGIAADNLMTMLREGGARVPTGKKQETFKRQTQSGLVVNELLWPIATTAGDVPWAQVSRLIGEEDFEKHESAVVELGFELFLKTVRIGQSKHIRVRPKFVDWAATGSITVFDDSITDDVLNNILLMAGTYCGVGDWRPSSPKSPGPWGKFRAHAERM